MRLAAITMNLPCVPKYSRVAKAVAPRTSLDDMICGSAHKITLQGKRLSCSVCLQGYHVQDKEHVQWLASPCTPSLPSVAYSLGPSAFPGIVTQLSGMYITDRPHPLVAESLHIGNQPSHSSHKLYVYRGLYFCNRCGCFSGGCKLHKLALQCSAPSPDQLKVKVNLWKGMLPRSWPKGRPWPDGTPP